GGRGPPVAPRARGRRGHDTPRKPDLLGTSPSARTTGVSVAAGQSLTGDAPERESDGGSRELFLTPGVAPLDARKAEPPAAAHPVNPKHPCTRGRQPEVPLFSRL